MYILNVIKCTYRLFNIYDISCIQKRKKKIILYNNINVGKQLFVVLYNLQRNIKLAGEREEGES